MSEFFLELFSEEMPAILQKSARENLLKLFKENFEFIEGFKKLHTTPFDTQQSFTFCVFRKVINR